MADLQRLIEWHEAESCNLSEGISAYRRDRHAETARILSLLEAVREGCVTEHTPMNTLFGDYAVRIYGPAETLRRLAELLGGGK